MHAFGYDKNSNITRYEAWRRIKERTGKHVAGIDDAPKLKDEVLYIWESYVEITKGCDKITWQELTAYQKLMGVEYTPWESSIMIDLDRVRRSNG